MVAAAGPAPVCPEEELSCGRLRPIASDGVRPYVNTEMGVEAIFPRGDWVCLARSGDAPRGFYTWMGTDEPCSEDGNPPAFISIVTSFNSAFDPSIEAAFADCRPISPDMARHSGGALAFAGHHSLTCETTQRDGRIEIAVHALAGRIEGASAGDPPAVRYTASLGTTQDRLDTDLAVFRAFLRQMRIGGS